MKTKRYAGSGMIAALVLGVCVLAPATPAPAMTTADQEAAILIWPSIHVDKANSVDTRINLVNHSSESKIAHCVYIDGTDCGPVDFWVYLTPQQPVSWLVSGGMTGPIDPSFQGLCKSGNQGSGKPCLLFAPLCPSGETCTPNDNNAGTAVPGRGNLFNGALKCVQFHNVDGSGAVPDTANSLSGSATLIYSSPDVEKYNAIGIKVIPPAPDGGATEARRDGILCLGETGLDACPDGPEYEACPSALILNNIFDYATNPLEVVPGGDAKDNRTMFTDLALVPCSDNFQRTGGSSVTAQFLVFNEFEQRFSSSTRVSCRLDKELSSIDTYGQNPERSIWSAFVSGTLAGQTRIRGVRTESSPNYAGLVGVARLKNRASTSNPGTFSADYTVHQQGDPKLGGDTIVLH